MGKAKMKNLYMHTLNRQPAAFSGEQICYACDGMKLSELFVDSLATVKQQQKASKEWRASKGFDEMRCSYIRIRVPADFEIPTEGA